MKKRHYNPPEDAAQKIHATLSALPPSQLFDLCKFLGGMLMEIHDEPSDAFYSDGRAADLVFLKIYQGVYSFDELHKHLPSIFR